ncbi:hypothetical protein BDEG_28308 [Batrachochytrium dendrobatidis JEL423]|uniref:Uncharacterized protein n=1 Tax=Batrachochytrium dendrobatidis (strain JEL423) TaxID=403673 RepID=A0A177WYG7_BATDL|nr:hypothetical protein BDEG_28308 [Batrachochytrium dendrobatidis JEL423]
MKLSIALSSILLVCSVTTANPVNPSATTSVEPSSSTAIFTATASTYPNPSPVSIAQAKKLVDFSKLSKNDMNLMEKYLKTSENYQGAKEALELEEPRKLAQEALVKRLCEKYMGLLAEWLKPKLNKEKKILLELEKVYQDLRLKIFDYNWILNDIGKELAKRLFGDGLDQSSIHSYMMFIKSNPRFIQSIQSTLGHMLGQQPGTEQASTSGTQSPSQHRESPSSSTHEVPKSPRSQKKSRSRAGKAYSKIKGAFGSSPNQDNTDDYEPLLD